MSATPPRNGTPRPNKRQNTGIFSDTIQKSPKWNNPHSLLYVTSKALDKSQYVPIQASLSSQRRMIQQIFGINEEVVSIFDLNGKNITHINQLHDEMHVYVEFQGIEYVPEFLKPKIIEIDDEPGTKLFGAPPSISQYYKVCSPSKSMVKSPKTERRLESLIIESPRSKEMYSMAKRVHPRYVPLPNSNIFIPEYKSTISINCQDVCDESSNHTEHVENLSFQIDSNEELTNSHSFNPDGDIYKDDSNQEEECEEEEIVVIIEEEEDEEEMCE